MSCYLLKLLVLTALLLISPWYVSGCSSPSEEETLVLAIQMEHYAHMVRDGAVSGSSGKLIQPCELVYQGAFRLPANASRPNTFAYGGAAMTFNPRGNPSGQPGNNPGSLFIMGHNRMPYGELPHGNQVAEVTIPNPLVSHSLNELNQAEFIQPFHDVAAGFFSTLDEIPRAGMQYLETSETGPLIHIAFGQHLQEDSEDMVASHAWFKTDLSTPDMKGTWYIGHQSLYSVNEYIFEIPSGWAEEHTGGRPLGTGRFKDGGWSGMGPALFAYRPWVDSEGTPAAPGTRLEEMVLLLYESSRHTNNIVHCLDGYQHPDEWSGGAWLTGDGGKTAVIFAGTKSDGDRYWYGFINPAGPDYACVESAFLGEFTLCRLADGTPCPDEAEATCEGHTSNRGWWSNRFRARFVFYDPAQLAAVASGDIQPWEPQPYAFLDIDEHLFFNPGEVEPNMLGSGVQRRYRLGDVAYDRENGWIYVLELFADNAKPVVHTWRIIAEDLPGEWTIIDGPGEAVPLETAWQINFNKIFSDEEIRLVEISRNETLIPVDLVMLPEDRQIIVIPREPYLPGEVYELRIILENSNMYKMIFTSDD